MASNGRWKLPLYLTPAPQVFNFNEIKGTVPLKYGYLYVRLEMHHENLDQLNILRADDTVQGYEIPGYLQENFNHAELDEFEANRNKDAMKRKMQRELALQRKKLLIQLMEREKRVRDKIKEEEEELRKKLEDDKRQKLQEELEDKKKELEVIKRELEEELRKVAEKKLENDRKKQERADNMGKILTEKVRTGVRVKLEGLKGFRSNYRLKVVYGLFVDNVVMSDDLGETMVYETQKYNDDDEKKVKNKEGRKINIKFENEEKEFVKNIQGLIYLNQSRKREVLLGFQVVTLQEKKVADITEVKDIDDEDPLKDLPLPEPEELTLIGWKFWSIASTTTALKDQAKKKDKKGKVQKLIMLAPPLLTIPFKSKYVTETKIELSFSYDTFTYDMDSLNYFAEKRLKSIKVNKDTFEKVKKQKYDKIYKEAFHVNDVPQYADLAFTKGAGIDVYIDASRFLPDNVTVTKVCLRV